MSSWTPSKVAMILLAIVAGFVVLVVLVGDGFGGVKEAYTKLKENSPNITVGSERATSKEVALPQDQQGQVNSLKATLNKMIKSPNNHCFENFGGFASDLGDEAKSTNIFFKYDEKTKNTTLGVVNRLGQWIVREEFNMTPCVIAGEGVAESFIDYYVDEEGQKPKKNVHYKEVEQISIFYQEDGFNGNAIRVKGQGFSDANDPVNDEGSNFEDGGLLYKASDNLICFFPVNQLTTDVDGVNDDHLVNTDREDTLISKYYSNKGRVKHCSSSDYEIIELFANSEWKNGGQCDNVGSDKIYTKSERLRDLKTEDEDCDSFVPSASATEGCYVFASEEDYGSFNDCGYAQASEGRIIPALDAAAEGIFTIPSTRETDGNEDPSCLLEQMRWTNDNNEALICSKTQAGFMWKSCSAGKEGRSVHIGSKGDYTCHKEGDTYRWKLTQSTS